ncbi:RIP metalloprotease RseP [Candidatus Saganbacteria bacterium]|nr:RIP metalloprotease RseP [Candidatus Saganbacteria bacterium]
MLTSLFAFLFVFTAVALAHEFGHFIAAKRSGIRVYEFALGFGPKLLSFKRGETVYAINLIPVLGYVKLAGMEGDEEEDLTCPEDRKYYNKPFKDKFLAVFSGPLMNLVLSFLILFFIYTLVGVPKDLSPVIDKVKPGSAAEKVGLKPGDRLVSINGAKVASMSKAIDLIHASSGRKLALLIDRSGHLLSMTAVPQLDPKLKIGLLGFTPKPLYVRVNVFEALYFGAQQTLAMVALMFIILWQLLAGAVSVRELAGPVGIAQVTGQYAQSGALSLFHFLAFLSINIGVINLLPLPALDGGHIVFAVIELVRRKPLDRKLEARIHQWGLVVFLALMALVTFNDILRIFRPK